MPCSITQHGLTRVGLEPSTSGSGVRGINHQATTLPIKQVGYIIYFFLVHITSCTPAEKSIFLIFHTLITGGGGGGGARWPNV